jgi:hypothetical protein
MGWRGKETHDHHIEPYEHEALNPVRLRVADNIVHEEACAEQQRDLKVIFLASSLLWTGRRQIELTEEHVQRLLGPPAKQDKERQPEEQELDAQVDRATLRELLGRRRRAEVALERVPDIEQRRNYTCVSKSIPLKNQN